MDSVAARVLWQYVWEYINQETSNNNIIEYINGILNDKLFILYNVTCVYA